jgi:hypothetical protein
MLLVFLWTFISVLVLAESRHSRQDDELEASTMYALSLSARVGIDLSPQMTSDMEADDFSHVDDF